MALTDKHPNVLMAWRAEGQRPERQPTQRAPRREPPPSEHPDVVRVWRSEIDLEATAANVIAAVSAASGISREVLLGDGRGEKHVADARAVAMWRLRELTGASYPAIGRVFGRHHTTVIHAVQRVQRELGKAGS